MNTWCSLYIARQLNSNWTKKILTGFIHHPPKKSFSMLGPDVILYSWVEYFREIPIIDIAGSDEPNKSTFPLTKRTENWHPTLFFLITSLPIILPVNYFHALIIVTDSLRNRNCSDLSSSPNDHIVAKTRDKYFRNQRVVCNWEQQMYWILQRWDAYVRFAERCISTMKSPARKWVSLEWN